MSLKARISSPLEAGASILDAHHLPSHLTSALEYTSKRLARKALHITLVVIRRDYQMPSPVPSPEAPVSAAVVLSPPPSPAPFSRTGVSSRAGFASQVAAIKQLVRIGASTSLSSAEMAQADRQRCKTVSPTFGMPSIDTSCPRMRWPLSPGVPTPPTPATPATPATTMSSTTTDGSGAPQEPNPFGIKLVYATALDPKAERILRQTIEKAERKFRIGFVHPEHARTSRS